MKQRRDYISIFLFCALVLISGISLIFFEINSSKNLDDSNGDLSSLTFDASSTYSICDLFTVNEAASDNISTCYSASITLPETITDIAFFFPTVDSSYSFYVNDSLVTLHLEDTAAPNIYFLHLESNKLYLELNLISNGVIDTSYNNPINTNKILIGTPYAITGYQSDYVFLDASIAIVYLILALLNLAMFIFRRDTRPHLFLLIFSLTSMAGILLTNQRLIKNTGLILSELTILNILVLVDMVRLTCITIFHNDLFKQKTNKIILYGIWTINAIMAIIGLLGDTKISSFIIALYILIITVTTFVFLHHGFIQFKILRDTDTRMYIFAAMILLLGSSFDVLNLISVSKLTYVFPICQVLFILLHTVRYTRQYHQYYKSIMYLTPKLKDSVFELQNNRSTYISSHIKPDYLYETLETIEKYIDTDSDKVDSLVQALAKYLRMTLDFSGDGRMTTINEEIDFCKAYIKLIKEQHPSYSFVFNIPDELPNVSVPSFSIQAVIENSVTHAFVGILHPEVIINIVPNDSFLNVSIRDNGIGMSDYEISMAIENPTEHVNIGLYHINQLLIDKCKTKLSVTSQVNRYTQVSFRVPMEVSNNEG